MPSHPDRHRRRREAIREILGGEAIRSQGELLGRLAERGFQVTQSSVSRDLQDLGVAKVEGRYVLAETLAGLAAPQDGLAEVAPSITRVVPAGPNLLVLRTGPGRAQLVSVALDAARWPEIVGTLAGDDTVFIATAGRSAQARIQARLQQIARESLQ